MDTWHVERYLNSLVVVSESHDSFDSFCFQLTWADFYFTAILDYLNYLTKTDLIAHHENLRQVVINVLEQESIKTWVEKRPKTEC